jgi:histidine triad (HIT) family protein
MEENCLFCKIVSKQIPAKIIFEDSHVLAFLDVAPRAIGHTMVIPKVHAPNILALPAEELAPLFDAVKKVDGMLSKALRPDGMTIGVNQGRASGQEVDHLHVHLMPRWHNDGEGSIQSVVNTPPQESLDVIAEKIKIS